MTDDVVQLAASRAARYLARLAAALSASRANASFPDVRAAAAHLRLAAGPLAVVLTSGLPSYQAWARMRADWQVAREASVGGRARGLVGLPAPRLGDLGVAERSNDRRTRRLQVTLDKVATDGRMLRLLAHLTVDRSLDDQALLDLLFPAADLPVELLLVRLVAAPGVRAVERVNIGAVDIFADIEADVPPVDPPRLALAAPGAVALSLSTASCALDLTPGDNDVLSVPATGDAAAVRQRLGTAALPHRLYLDRKLVLNAVARPVLEQRVRARGTRTVLYPLEAP
ncbi:MAG: hypothetical protein A2138_20590 [Deltaproteobacteria bacterium RBG_16_71_12]|nr:MAG: hypothetical protein A2138_20590 [Deltaproteobacteria bacterium RBG_16_71_12]